jgi:hypothetical protein
MKLAQRHVDHDALASEPPISLNLRRLQPVEIVLLCRHVYRLPIDGFPLFNRLTIALEKQLIDLPRADLPFGRRVYETFAMSPLPVDRLTIALLVRWLTLVDHNAGFSLWHRLVRDQDPTVRQEAYEPIHHHFTHPHRPPAEGFEQEGLTLADAHALRAAFTRAHQTGHCHVIGQTAVTDTLRETTHSIGRSPAGRPI